MPPSKWDERGTISMSLSAPPEQLSEAQHQALAAAYRRIMESAQRRREAEADEGKQQVRPVETQP